MKIAFLFGSMARGGAERVIASLANTYCKEGDDVSIITLDNTSSGYQLDERVKHVRLNLAGKSRSKLEALSRNLRIIRHLREEVLCKQYDAVIAFDLRLTVLLQCAVPFGRKFKIISSERANPNQRKLPKIVRLCYDWFIPRVDGFVFQTERVSLCYPKKLRQIGTVIHNGIFPEILPAGDLPNTERRYKDICAIGRLSHQKGYDILLQAFATFWKSHPEHHLHIYGEGKLRQEISTQILQLGLGACVTLHGSTPDVMFQVADMGMFILSSRYEGMPNALMEAMACGLPCIAADCDFGPAELLHDGENGLLVPVEDPNALANAMSRIADDKDLASRLSENARNIRITHNGGRIAQQYHDYITSVIGVQPKDEINGNESKKTY